jgi:RNA polymerase sigma factor (sigma-70 family)
MAATDTQAVIEAVWRIESARLIGALTRAVRDVDFAEELAQDALVAALERWPSDGIPDNPGAWLMTAARNRAIDVQRRRRSLDAKSQELGRELEQRERDAPDVEALLLDAEFGGDDVLRLVFMTCHPILATDARVALTLRLVGGLAVNEIARAFLTTEATISQRIVRAKRRLVEAQVPFEVPSGSERDERLASVLEVVYLIFNEGYAATSGDEWMRPELCRDAMRLGRVLAALAPREPEVLGLAALMELQASRLPARTGPDGEPILLLDQQRARGDRLLIRHGLELLERARALHRPPGPNVLQASIAACHARAGTADATDWAEIASLYGQLARVLPSPVVELNRAVAVSMAWGAERGLELVDALVAGGALKRYHPLPAARGDLLDRLGRFDEAAVEFERAATLTDNARERAVLRARATACAKRAVNRT